MKSGAVQKSEKRRVPRLTGKLPVELESGTGITRDFSSSGVFFETDCAFIAGQPIEFTLLLKNIDSGSPVRVKCSGESVRIEECGLMSGVAATIHSYTLI